MRSGMLGMALLAAGGIAVGVTAPTADAAVGHPALTWVYNTYYGATADASGCSQVGGIGYSQGQWIDWYCYESYVAPIQYNDQWELVVTD